MRKFVPIILIAILLFLPLATFVVQPISAQEPDQPPPKGAPLSSSQTAQPTPTPSFNIDGDLFSKIEPPLLKRLLVGERSPFIVYLKAKADVQAAVDGAIVGNTSDQSDELVKRAAVVETLEQTARNSQAGVLQLLNDSASPGGLSGQSVATTDIHPLWIVNGVAAEGSLETVLALAARPDVEIVRLDKEVKLDRPPNTSALITNLQTPQWGISKIRADLVHNALGIDGSGAVVANVDTGVDWQHPALQSQYRGYTGPGHLPQHTGNWHDSTGEGATYPVDTDGHGTHTMGTMVGGQGVGVAPGAQWIAVKAFDSSGTAQNSWLHEAFQWLLKPNGDVALAPDVISNSWSNSSSTNLEFEADIQALLTAGIYPVFAAGNNGPRPGSVGSPASLQGVFSVGAISIDDEIANFSGRGPSPWDEVKPEVVAPGKDVISTFPGGAYYSLNGTSMATPHVAGLAALLLQAEPSLEPNEISSIMMATAKPLGNATPNNDYGWGRIDAYNAVMSVGGSGTLKGTLTRASNSAPIPNAAVEIKPRDGGPAVTVNTDSSGVYLQGLAAGTYDVTAFAFGYTPLTVFNVDVTTGTQTIQNFALLSAPAGIVQGTVKDKATNKPLAATVSAIGTPAQVTTNAVDSSYSLVLPVGTYKIKVAAEGHRLARTEDLVVNDGATLTQNFTLDTSPSILLVDSGKWYQESQISYYQLALDDALYPYDLWQITEPFETPNDIPMTSTLSSYDIVIWSSPQDSPGYIGADAVIRGFLDDGGKLLLSGQDVAFFDSGANFTQSAPYLLDYLKVKFSEDNAGTTIITGTTNGPFANLSLTITGGDGADNQTTPDVITNADPDFAAASLLYDENGDRLAGLHVGLCVPYRAMFLPFGFEAINSRTDRSQMIAQTIDWFLEPPASKGVELKPKTATVVGDFGSTVDQTFQVRNIGSTSDTYNLSFESNWPVNPTPPATLSMESCETKAITMGVTVETTDWHVADTLTLTAQSNSNSLIGDTITRVTKSPAPVLLVDDDRFIDVTAQFQDALNQKNIPYDYQEVPKSWRGAFPPSPPLETLQKYPVVVWYTGYDWFQPLIPAEEDRLQAYLEGGGRLFLSGQDYIYNLPDNIPGDFAQNYLGILTHMEDYSSTVAINQMGNPIGTNLGRYDLEFPLGYQNNTDGLIPTSSARIISLGEEDQVNALMNNGLGAEGEPWRTTFFAYGPELLADAERAKLMQRVVGWLGWLGTSTVTPDKSAALAGEVINYTAVITNDGWDDIATAHFTATFPAELTLDTGSYSSDLTLINGDLIWSGPLAKNERKVFNYSATLVDSLPLGTIVSQTSWVAYDDHNLSVDRIANVCVNCPDLETSTFIASPANDLLPGDVLTYTLVLRNNGLVDDPMVTTTNTLPHLLDFVTDVDTAGQGTVIQDGNNITWMTPLAVNQVATLTYQTVISYRTRAWSFDNVAYVRDDIVEPLKLKAKADFKVYPRYFPIISKQ